MRARTGFRSRPTRTSATCSTTSRRIRPRTRARPPIRSTRPLLAGTRHRRARCRTQLVRCLDFPPAAACAVAAGLEPDGGADIPALGWSSVPGALSYGVHVDYPSGTTKDFTVFSTVFTPTEFYGNGVWHWKVRANFPNGAGTRSVGGAYSRAVAYTRLIPAPGGARDANIHRVLVTWNPDPHAYRYRLQTSRTRASTDHRECHDADVRLRADAQFQRLPTGGQIYWRIASQDKGDNQGAFASGTFVFPRSFQIKTSGTARRGRRSRLVVTLRNASRKPITGARVTISGAGIRKASKRVDRHGSARFSVRPKRRGSITIRVHKTGYTDALATVRCTDRGRPTAIRDRYGQAWRGTPCQPCSRWRTRRRSSAALASTSTRTCGSRATRCSTGTRRTRRRR